MESSIIEAEWREFYQLIGTFDRSLHDFARTCFYAGAIAMSEQMFRALNLNGTEGCASTCKALAKEARDGFLDATTNGRNRIEQ